MQLQPHGDGGETRTNGNFFEADQLAEPSGSGRDLRDKTRPFAQEHTGRSWFEVTSTIGLLAAALFFAATSTWWPLRTVLSILAGLVLVRAFILYHDYLHQALLRESRLANLLFRTLGLLMLSPPRYWQFSHNFHHGKVGKVLPSSDEPGGVVTSDLGAFPLMSTDAWLDASTLQRILYRIHRHPLTLLVAYVTVFLYSLCILPFVTGPRRYWDSGLSILLHGALIALVWYFAGFSTTFFTVLLPFTIASSVGACLFFVQHNYEGMQLLESSDWDFYAGAIEASSFLELGPVLCWFTGNIGYHHIHHLNPLIPFYRLPEVMAAVPELKQATEGRELHLGDIAACFWLNLWDKRKCRLVSYGEALADPSG